MIKIGDTVLAAPKFLSSSIHRLLKGDCGYQCGIVIDISPASCGVRFSQFSGILHDGGGISNKMDMWFIPRGVLTKVKQGGKFEARNW